MKAAIAPNIFVCVTLYFLISFSQLEAEKRDLIIAFDPTIIHAKSCIKRPLAWNKGKEI